MEIEDFESLLEAYKSGMPIKYIFFWDGYLSNWWPAKFNADGVQYPTSEHYFMAHKAMTFNDKNILRKMLRPTILPSDVKRLGRKVKGFNNAKWNMCKERIMIEGNMQKFSQNYELKKYLLSTGDKVLVEASPYDRIWGIGMGEGAKGIEDPFNWKGQNLLGFCLMKVRERLRDKKIRKSYKINTNKKIKEEKEWSYLDDMTEEELWENRSHGVHGFH